MRQEIELETQYQTLRGVQSEIGDPNMSLRVRGSGSSPEKTIDRCAEEKKPRQ
jgi:hypothetical protein